MGWWVSVGGKSCVRWTTGGGDDVLWRWETALLEKVWRPECRKAARQLRAVKLIAARCVEAQWDGAVMSVGRRKSRSFNIRVAAKARQNF